jgi:glycosyltransferase involved in cell wall biosynthesis
LKKLSAFSAADSLPHVAFVLPATSRTPIGGHKIFYEYANALAEDGYDVWVVHSFTGTGCPRPFSFRGVLHFCDVCLHSVWHKLRGWHRSPTWFPLDARVHFRVVWSLAESRLPPADLYLFSDANSAAIANRYQTIPPQRIFHFVQGHETWSLSPGALASLYRSPTRKIAVSEWLRREVEKAGGRAEVIPNFFDFCRFRLETPPESRDSRFVGMLFHRAACKDADTGLKALELAKIREPALRACLFGAFPMDRELPPWISYLCNPSPTQLLGFYNEISVFLGTSRLEGWGLTVGEAMVCGAAVVCTDNPGYADMAVDGETALVVPAGNPPAMADALLRLVRDGGTRAGLAHAARQHIANFTKACSVERLKGLLLKAFQENSAYSSSLSRPR